MPRFRPVRPVRQLLPNCSLGHSGAFCCEQAAGSMGTCEPVRVSNGSKPVGEQLHKTAVLLTGSWLSAHARPTLPALTHPELTPGVTLQGCCPSSTVFQTVFICHFVLFFLDALHSSLRSDACRPKRTWGLDHPTHAKPLLLGAISTMQASASSAPGAWPEAISQSPNLDLVQCEGMHMWGPAAGAHHFGAFIWPHDFTMIKVTP